MAQPPPASFGPSRPKEQSSKNANDRAKKQLPVNYEERTG
eukprot:CAMPEP_0202063872 /NCGR_PEP_ID=MMETSP0963-20130614/47649_1 /ASSEMBLY_ACC=CAM_ASM_000494 /TAXON_ID=4773 /ORGANISM="Schizochytrium aggregatum, Strain ATCC28209" /LENGTH=39 /DNA_ID= /DNA_START= /DNA_END= /DNA_ORIENTATION=